MAQNHRKQSGWTRPRRVRDRQVPGSNPGPPTNPVFKIGDSDSRRESAATAGSQFPNEPPEAKRCDTAFVRGKCKSGRRHIAAPAALKLPLSHTILFKVLNDPQSHPVAGGRLLCAHLDRAHRGSGAFPRGLHTDPPRGPLRQPRDRGGVCDYALGAYRFPRGRGRPSLAMDFLAGPDRFLLRRVACSSLGTPARRDDSGQRPYLVRGAARCNRSRPVHGRDRDGGGLSESWRLGRFLIRWIREVDRSSVRRCNRGVSTVGHDG